jgi:hypothetical protein
MSDKNLLILSSPFDVIKLHRKSRNKDQEVDRIKGG